MRLTGTVVRSSSTSLCWIARDTAMRWSMCGRQLAQERLVLGGADPAGVDGRDQVRPAVADLGEGQDRSGRDGLGAVHVGVDDVGPDLGQVRGERADGDRVVGIVDDEDRDRRALELAHGAAGRHGDDRHVVAARVDPGDERLEVLLGAPVRAGRDDLDDADPVAGQDRPLDGLETGVRGARGGHLTWSYVEPARAGWARRPRPTRTCRVRRRGGSRGGACPGRGRARHRRGP